MDEKISWDPPEYLHKPKDADWYWAIGIITVSIIVTSIILNNVLFAILVFLSVFALTMYGAKPPKKIHVEINKNGILIEKSLYPYSNLKSFDITGSRLGEKLLIKSQKALSPLITIPLADQNSDEISEFLEQYISKEEIDEPLLHQFMEYLGF